MRESDIEKHLVKQVKSMGGLCLKLAPINASGLPDRLILLPEGICIFAELKAPKQSPRPLQLYVHKKLRKLGFTVLVFDSKIEIDKWKNYYISPTTTK